MRIKAHYARYNALSRVRCTNTLDFAKVRYIACNCSRIEFHIVLAMDNYRTCQHSNKVPMLLQVMLVRLSTIRNLRTYNNSNNQTMSLPEVPVRSTNLSFQRTIVYMHMNALLGQAMVPLSLSIDY